MDARDAKGKPMAGLVQANRAWAGAPGMHIVQYRIT
jgi:hypothetical protein